MPAFAYPSAFPRQVEAHPRRCKAFILSHARTEKERLDRFISSPSTPRRTSRVQRRQTQARIGTEGHEYQRRRSKGTKAFETHRIRRPAPNRNQQLVSLEPEILHISYVNKQTTTTVTTPWALNPKSLEALTI